MILVYFSPTQTTKRVLESIASGCGLPYETIDITLNKERHKSLIFDEDDIVLIGAPVYSGRIPEITENYFKSMIGGGAMAVPIVVYGNRHYDDALLELNDLCLLKGFRTVAAGAFIGEHSYTSEVAHNRPDEKDQAAAFDFGAQIVWQSKHLDLPGNSPYRPRQKSLPIAPSTKETCSGCGVCVANCPVDAISSVDKQADENKCIKCFSCVKKCYHKAKYFDERLDHVKRWLVDNYSIRREPEIWT